tara:strand:- start:597 stop:1232 length:636 start_codon:yes stop_codon:yes gene_type:complete
MINKNLIDEYCISNSATESELLKKIREETYKNEDLAEMISGPLVINFLKSLIKLSNSKKILEIGMFTGYSAFGMAEALPENGEIHTCELMLKHVKTVKKILNKSKYKNNIYIHHGAALDLIENFSIKSFDFIFIDADKINYIEYYKRAMHLLKNNGIIVLDNMLWSGKVLDPQTEVSKVLNELNQLITNDKRNTNMLIPIRDGLMLCFKNE